MAYFVGFGYSDGFSRNMSRLLTELRPETSIQLTIGADVVCGSCPNNVNGSCNKPELVAAYDRAVLEYCGLTDGEILGFGWFTGLVQEKILTPGHRADICGNCQWNDICASQPSRWGPGRTANLETIPRGLSNSACPVTILESMGKQSKTSKIIKRGSCFLPAASPFSIFM